MHQNSTLHCSENVQDVKTCCQEGVVSISQTLTSLTLVCEQEWVNVAQLRNLLMEADVCVTIHNWANDAGISFGPCQSILTQVANMQGIVKIHAYAD